jgi:hypothetical protein
MIEDGQVPFPVVTGIRWRITVVGMADVLGNSGLNEFLHAEVGTEASGMPLSVLSTLARLGVDPWQEAGRLAKLPRKAAVNGLAQMIAGMPASRWPLPDATRIAERLVALLPTGRTAATLGVPGLVGRGTDAGARLKSLLPVQDDSSAARGSPPSRASAELIFLLAAAVVMMVGLVVIGTTHPPLVAASPAALVPTGQ